MKQHELDEGTKKQLTEIAHAYLAYKAGQAASQQGPPKKAAAAATGGAGAGNEALFFAAAV